MPGFWGMIYFQEGVESVGHVTVRNLRRVDAPDCRNANYTVRLGAGVRIDTLILDNVCQRLPDDKPLIFRDPGVTIKNLIQRPE